MYIPEYFRITDKKDIYSFIDANAFGQLTSMQNDRLVGTHLPFILSPDRTYMLAHLAKQNPQLENLEGQEVLVSLQGPHDYISPSWYEGRGVPTWNYQSVHVYGICRLIDNEETLADILKSLTERYEAVQEKPWEIDYSPSMLKGIVGVEVLINEIQCKYKLSQNRSVKDRENVSDALEANGAGDLALEMRKLL